jgi:hypothetical protein
MDLPVAIRVKQNPIFGCIFPSVHPPHKMVVVPPCELGDLLLTDWTESFLLFPEGEQLPFPLEIVYHLDAEAFFKVLFPSGIVGVCFSLDFHMSLDRDICRVQEIIFYAAFFGYDDSVEDPILSIDGFKVSLFHPLFGFVGMSPFCPSPQGTEDGMANSGEGDFTHDVLVIVCPSPNDGVQLDNQITCRCLFVGLDERPYLL